MCLTLAFFFFFEGGGGGRGGQWIILVGVQLPEGKSFWTSYSPGSSRDIPDI